LSSTLLDSLYSPTLFLALFITQHLLHQDALAATFAHSSSQSYRHSSNMRHAHTPKIISGTVPGKLDPTQPSRVLHHPNSTLSFAGYSPFTARTDYEQYELDPASREELLSGRRIVVETSDLGECIWRFVPRAHLLHGVNDEGVFPRPVHFCEYALSLSI